MPAPESWRRNPGNRAVAAVLFHLKRAEFLQSKRATSDRVDESVRIAHGGLSWLHEEELAGDRFARSFAAAGRFASPICSDLVLRWHVLRLDRCASSRSSRPADYELAGL